MQNFRETLLHLFLQHILPGFDHITFRRILRICRQKDHSRIVPVFPQPVSQLYPADSRKIYIQDQNVISFFYL